MKRTCIFLMLIPLLLSCAAVRSSFTALPEGADRPALLKVYLKTLCLLSPEYMFLHSLETESRQERILASIGENRAAVERLDIKEGERCRQHLRNLDRVLLPDLLDYFQRQRLKPSEAEMRSYYNQHITDFAEEDYIRSIRAIIVPGPDMEKKADALAQDLKNSESSFEKVLSRHGYAPGNTDSLAMIKIRRGMIPNDQFDALLKSEPQDPYVGPVPVQEGVLFGKVYELHKAGPKPFEIVRKEIEGVLLKERLQRFYDDFYAAEKARHDLVDLTQTFTGLPKPDESAYRYDGETFLYSQVRESCPGVVGKADTPEFFRSVTRIALNNRLMLDSDAAQGLKDTAEYRFIINAFRDQCLVHEFLQDRYASISATEEDLREFYEEHKETQYRKPPQVRLVLFVQSRNPDNVKHPYGMEMAGRQSLQEIRRVRADFIASASPEEFCVKYKGIAYGMRIRCSTAAESLGDLHPLIQKDIDGHDAGYTSPILVDRAYYTFYHVLELESDRPFMTFEEIRDRVRADYFNMFRKAIREEYDLKYQQ